MPAVMTAATATAAVTAGAQVHEQHPGDERQYEDCCQAHLEPPLISSTSIGGRCEGAVNASRRFSEDR
jgi:hypothetical protein